jgi:hypothetical protein
MSVALMEPGWRVEAHPVDMSKSVAANPAAGYRFPCEVIAVAVGWYLRCGLSYRDVEELLDERGISVDQVPTCRWVQTFTAEFIDAARRSMRVSGDRWFVDETYVKVGGRWTICTGPSISTARSSTCTCPQAATVRPRGRSSPARSDPAPFRSKSPRTRHRSIQASLTSSFPMLATCSSSTRSTRSKLITAESPAASDSRTQNDPLAANRRRRPVP